jgi:hypothetical protein
MAKRKVPHKHCQVYLNNRKRIKNKTKILEKKLEKLESYRKQEVINPNTKLPVVRKFLGNIVKSCRIGRNAEGFVKEDFKFRPRKRKEVIDESKNGRIEKTVIAS